MVLISDKRGCIANQLLPSKLSGGNGIFLPLTRLVPKHHLQRDGINIIFIIFMSTQYCAQKPSEITAVTGFDSSTCHEGR